MVQVPEGLFEFEFCVDGFFVRWELGSDDRGSTLRYDGNGTWRSSDRHHADCEKFPSPGAPSEL